jgi:hypothetical protein
VLIQLDAYEQLQRAVDYDTSNPDPERSIRHSPRP